MELEEFQQHIGVRPSPRLLVAYDLFKHFKHRSSFQRGEALGIHPRRKLVERSLQALVDAGLARKNGLQYSIIYEMSN